MQVCRYAGLQICRFADMQVCRYAGLRVSGIYLCGFHDYAPSRGFLVFTPYAGWQDMGFMVFFTLYASTIHICSLHIVEFKVPWITEDHGSVLNCWRLVLSAAFVSSVFVRFRECLVS